MSYGRKKMSKQAMEIMDAGCRKPYISEANVESKQQPHKWKL